MDYKTKEYYRTQIKEIGAKTKISEIYIAKKILELSQKALKGTKENHIGYYLIDKGKALLYQELGFKYKKIEEQNKMKIYILAVYFFAVSISILLGITIRLYTATTWITAILATLILIIPVSEIVIQILQ